VINQAAHVGGMVIGFVLTTVLLPRGDSDLSDLL
jgi:membrane associated rhomboid family serine protease